MPNDLSHFLGQLVRHPQEVVALAPSSAALAREMCRGLGPGTGPVAELGPGTGKITRSILETGVDEASLTLFELNPVFCEILRSNYRRATIRNASAQRVGELPPASQGAVVSGLPLLSMPNDVQRDIVAGAMHALRPGGEFIQFTYGPVPPVAQEIREELGLSWTYSRRIWGNLPPARVYRFRKAPLAS